MAFCFVLQLSSTIFAFTKSRRMETFSLFNGSRKYNIINNIGCAHITAYQKLLTGKMAQMEAKQPLWDIINRYVILPIIYCYDYNKHSRNAFLNILTCTLQC